MEILDYVPAIISFMKAQWLGVVAIFLALIIYALQRTTKRPWYSTNSSVIAADERSATRGLEISFRGQRMTRVCITKMIVWNSGNLAIRSADIPASHPMRITPISGVTILDAEILQTNNTNSEVKSNFVDGSINITFDYLAPQNGLVLNVVHTGKGGRSLALDAQFIDSKPLRRVPVLETPLFRRIPLKAAPDKIKFMRTVLPLIFVIVGGVPIAGEYFTKSPGVELLPVLVTTALYWGIAAFMYYFRIPSGLEIYFE